MKVVSHAEMMIDVVVDVDDGYDDTRVSWFVPEKGFRFDSDCSFSARAIWMLSCSRVPAHTSLERRVALRNV